jgi:hypothetical protein
LVRRHYQYATGFAALRWGARHDAMRHLGAAACWRPRLRKAYALWLLARLAPSDRSATRLLDAMLRAADVSTRLLRGQLSVAALGKKLLKRLRQRGVQ